MALFEAMASGVPAITTRNTGASELLRNGHDALVLDAQDVPQIEQSLRALYESPELRQRVGLAGQATIASLMDGEIARPYEEGIDRLFAAVAQRSAVPVA